MTFRVTVMFVKLRIREQVQITGKKQQEEWGRMGVFFNQF